MKNNEGEIETATPGPTMSRAISVWYVLAVVLITACAAFSFVVRAHSLRDRAEDGHAIAPVSMSKPSPAPARQAQQPAVIIAGLGVTLTRQGFQPGKITRSPRRFVLAVVNKTGLDSLSLSLDSPLGAAVRSKQLPKEEPRWSDVYDLSPGRYTLRETNHPDWVCEIIVN